MTNKGLVIVNAYEVLEPFKHLINRLKEEFEDFGIELEVHNPGEVLAWVGENGWVYHWELPYDFCIYLDKDPYLSVLLERSGLRLFNSADAIRICDDKMLTYAHLSHRYIRMPITIAGPLQYSNKHNDNFIDAIPGKLHFPIVGKLCYGSQGKGIFLLEDEKQLKAFEKEHEKEPRLYQEFIASSKGFDYRVIVIGGKAIASMKREAKDGFKSNLAQGGKGYPIALPPDYLKLAEDAASAIGLDYCGVDILEGTHGEPYLCEVNSNAFIEGIEEATGLNIAWVYAYYIFHEIYK